MAIYGCVRMANFPYQKTFDDYDFSFQPSINKDQILDFKNLRFLENKENIIFVGSPGLGANLLFQLINKRYEKSTTVITTNQPFTK